MSTAQNRTNAAPGVPKWTVRNRLFAAGLRPCVLLVRLQLTLNTVVHITIAFPMESTAVSVGGVK